MVDNKKIGAFIAQERKNANLTQKELADRLNITDKAVSKWERGAGYPDISFLEPLAEAIGCSVEELLRGEKKEDNKDKPNNDPKDELIGITSGKSIEGHSMSRENVALNSLSTQYENSATSRSTDVRTALSYAEEVMKEKNTQKRQIAAAITAVSLILSVMICIICDYSINRSLTWAYLVAASCAVSAGISIPPLLWLKKGVIISLVFLGITIVPFLKLIEFLYSETEWVEAIGIECSIVMMLYLCILTVLLFMRRKYNIWILIGMILIVTSIFQMFINNTINTYIRPITSEPITDIISFFESQYADDIIEFVSIFGAAILFITAGIILNIRKKKVKILA